MKVIEPLIEFTSNHVSNRNLVIELLLYEDKLFQSQYGQTVYQNTPNALFSSEPQIIIQRRVLVTFGFSSSDDSIKHYHTIFAHYYNNPFEYDKQVMNAVTYFRENKILYYQKPALQKGQIIPDVMLQRLINKTNVNKETTTLYNEIETKTEIPVNGTFICAFSGS
jgi:hypothetical protein